MEDSLKLSNNWNGSSELLVYHKSKDTHHGGTAVVQFNGALGGLGIRIEGVPAKVKSAVAEVTRELTLACNIPHYEDLKEANEGNHLKKTSLRDGVRSEEGSQAVGVGVEGVSGVVDGSCKVDSIAGYDLAKEGKLGDTSVLNLNIAEAVEALLVGILEKAKRILLNNRRKQKQMRKKKRLAAGVVNRKDT